MHRMTRLVVAVMAVCARVSAERPATGPANGAATPAGVAATQGAGEALSPRLAAALKELAADDFQTRQDAGVHIQAALAEAIHGMAATDDPEAAARVAELLRFTAGLSEWAASTMRLSPERRKAALDWGLDPAHAGLVGGAYSRGTAERARAAKALVKLSDPMAQDLVAMLLRDPERPVYLAAMDGIWDQEPTPAMIDALWDRAVQAGADIYGPRRNMMGAVLGLMGGGQRFRGQDLAPLQNYATFYARMQDSDVATRVLAHVRGEGLDRKLIDFLAERAKPDEAGVPLFSPQGGMQNLIKLIQGSKSRKLVAVVYGIAIDEENGEQNRFRIGGGDKGVWTTRTAATGILVKLTGQKLADYKIKRMDPWDTWEVPTEADEKANVEKLKAWWGVHHGEYDRTGAGAGTQPGGK